MPIGNVILCLFFYYVGEWRRTCRATAAAAIWYMTVVFVVHPPLLVLSTVWHLGTHHASIEGMFRPINLKVLSARCSFKKMKFPFTAASHRRRLYTTAAAAAAAYPNKSRHKKIKLWETTSWEATSSSSSSSTQNKHLEQSKKRILYNSISRNYYYQ